MEVLSLILFICFNSIVFTVSLIFFIRTDCVVSDSSLWNESLKKMGLNSWYSVQMSVPKVVKPLNSPSRFLRQDITEYVQPPTAKEDKKLPKSKSSKIPAGKARCIRLFPTQEERLKLRQWIGTTR
jgi:hypothetical protein